ncbi:hypothetical protein EGR_05998 [Echinococcus granulosus]|uniref:DUF5734 domain-containing protein n=1 Tax=Echinococcus granulosus TaxID=6210 RepID=W6UCW0_ECHGR|nr:hypothetical protein EGR_05998 [Echinococcus granulosus]EUB59135.1 hypothetical protein EGR_05998 [Echinococcus granulosus]
MNPQMTKELQKAAKAKPKGVKSTITNEKAVFQNKKEATILENMAKIRKSRRTSPDLCSTTALTKITATSDDKSSSTTLPQKGKRNSVSHSRLRNGHTPAPHTPVQKPHHTRSSVSQKSGTSMRGRSVGAATYVTTDVLAKHRRPSSTKRGGRVSAKDVYPMKEKGVKRGGRNHTEMKYLTYVPGKGMVKSTRSNDGNLYSLSRRNVSSSASSSSSSSSSSSTSTTNSVVKPRLSEIAPIHRLNNNFLNISSGSSSNNSSSKSSTSTLSSSIILAETVKSKKEKNIFFKAQFMFSMGVMLTNDVVIFYSVRVYIHNVVELRGIKLLQSECHNLKCISKARILEHAKMECICLPSLGHCLLDTALFFSRLELSLCNSGTTVPFHDNLLHSVINCFDVWSILAVEKTFRFYQLSNVSACDAKLLGF